VDNWKEYPGSLNDLITMNITANDLKTGQDLWTFVIPANNINDITLDSSNIGYLDYPASDMANRSVEYNKKHPELQNLSKSEIGPWNVDRGAQTILILPTENVIYVSYYAYNYEYPRSLTSPPYDDGSDAYKYAGAAVFNRSKIAFISDIYAIDNKGHLLWDRPTDSMITSMASNNSTIYYGTESGRIFATQANIALGFALVAVAYLFIRFFCVGAVARARNRTNENRSVVLQYVVANPGSTLRDISRGLHMNLGTARYHMFILSINHRVVAYQADGKHVRYFNNSGTYSKEEQMIMSILRRDGMRKILGLLLTKPGLSNAQLSGELGIQESAVSRYMKELAERGIVVKELAPMGTSAYFLSNDRMAHVVKAMDLMNGA
jgi:predicted transcriptional regulator